PGRVGRAAPSHLWLLGGDLRADVLDLPLLVLGVPRGAAAPGRQPARGRAEPGRVALRGLRAGDAPPAPAGVPRERVARRVLRAVGLRRGEPAPVRHLLASDLPPARGGLRSLPRRALVPR